MNAMQLVGAVRRLAQDTASTHHTDAEIVALLARSKRAIFGHNLPALLTDEQEEALAIVVAFRLLQARDAAAQLESLATCQG